MPIFATNMPLPSVPAQSFTQSARKNAPKLPKQKGGAGPKSGTKRKYQKKKMSYWNKFKKK